MSKEQGYLLLLFAILIGIIGYARNVMYLVKCDFEAPYKAEVLRIVGTFPLFGPITGWIPYEDKKHE